MQKISNKRIFILLVIGLSVFLFASGCGTTKATTPSASLPPADLPDDPAALLSLADQSYAFKGPEKNVEISLAAAEKALTEKPGDESAEFFAARASFWLAEYGDRKDLKQLAERGLAHAQKAASLNSGKAEYPYLEGILLGIVIRESMPPPVTRLKEVQGYFQRAVDIDPGLDEGGPIRAMGMLLIHSPSWPIGVGDPDQGIEELRKAAKLYPSYPANHLYLAQALLDIGNLEEARIALSALDKTFKAADWGVPGEKWKHQGEQLNAKLRQKTADK